MSYNAKTNWQQSETVLPADMNRIEQGIKDNDTQKAPISSPIFTGQPKAPTPNAADDDTRISTIKFVKDFAGNSILVNKYNIPTVVRSSTGSTQQVTGNPIPTSGWVNATDRFVKDGYEISAVNFNTNIPLAFDESVSTSYSVNNTSSWMKFKLPHALQISKIIILLSTSAGDGAKGWTLAGSNDDVSWTTLGTGTGVNTPVTIQNPGAYQYYRVTGTTSYLGQLSYQDIRVVEYTVDAYTNALTLASASVNLEANQRILIETPTTLDSVAVISNTFNGKNVDTILQPNKRYELVYNGTLFNAKEVL